MPSIPDLLNQALGHLQGAYDAATGTLDWQTIADSSNVAAAAYDAQAQQLYIRFKWGGTYRYDGVPDGLLDNLLSAGSPGQFVNQVIKPAYAVERVS